MIRYLARVSTDVLLRNQSIETGEADWYTYGFEMLFARVVNYALLFLVGVLMGQLLLTVVFCVIIFGLRGFTGGFHAGSSLVCTGCSIALLVGVLWLAPRIPPVATPALLLAMVPCCILVFCFAPVNHPDLEMDAAEIYKNRLLSRISASFVLALTVLVHVLGVSPAVVHTMCFSLSIVSVLILLAKIIKQEVR